MKRITVLLADDNRVVRRAFRKILELEDDLEVVGEKRFFLWDALAPEEGLEPSTSRLTAACSTIELLWNQTGA